MKPLRVVGGVLVLALLFLSTYTVQETLERLDMPWTFRNSRMSPMGLYCLLEEHPEHTVVLDDISSLFNQPQALQILMAAQIPLVAYFAIKWLPQAPKQALLVLALQAVAGLAAIASVFLLT